MIESQQIDKKVDSRIEERYISIVTHSDFDGLISAAIVLQKYPKSQIYYATPRNLYKVLYLLNQYSSPDMLHTIFILDLSIAEIYRTRTIKAIRDIRKEALVEIYWIDHHRFPNMEEMREYVELFVNPLTPHAAYLVHQLINDCPNSKLLLSILQSRASPFVEYWRAVLKETLQFILNYDLRIQVLRALASLNHTEFTDQLYQRRIQRETSSTATVDKIRRTNQGYQFGLLEFKGDMELYPKVRQVLNDEQLDFLLVHFEDGSLSAYKSVRSSVNLAPLFTLVGGKGHTYAFHFQPQARITDEFYRPMTIPDLLIMIQGVL